MSDKVTADHLGRAAILYIRQSSPHQVQHNEESRRLQYAMRDRLGQLGWSEVAVIDDDLGRSAGGTIERAGFERLVAAVSLGDVGVVAARELSRFARNSRDWQKLMEVCRLVDTLLVDQDAVYSTRQSNDRLLLGLKGTMNEYELDLLRLRGLEARREKAARGEYYAKVAVGYRKTDDGRLEMTPDLRVQQALRLSFAKFFELGSARQVLLWMREQGLKMPVNRNHRGEVIWKTPSFSWLYQVITNPIYAGAYVYGRTSTRRAIRDGEVTQRIVRVPRGEWKVLLHDRVAAYIDWNQFERIQTMLSKNSQARRARSSAPGAAKRGSALVAGLLRCRRCGQRLLVSYGGPAARRVARYTCVRDSTDRGGDPCVSFSSVDVDDHVGRAVLAVTRPAAIEASRRAAASYDREKEDVIAALSLERQAAHYAAERAFRQYDAVDPENRLVADELERRWNEALERTRELDERLERARSSPVGPRPDLDDFLALGETFSRVWNNPGTDARLKKRLIRAVIEEIVVDVDQQASQIVLLVHWKGGVHSELRVGKLRRGHHRASTPPDVVEAVRSLALVCADEEIAAWLNRAEIRTGRGNRWTRALVTALRSSRDIAAYSDERCRREGWITLERAAAIVGVASLTLRRAIVRGAIRGQQPVPRGPWLLRREDVIQPGIRERLFKRSRERSGQPAEPGTKQLNLDISKT